MSLRYQKSGRSIERHLLTAIGLALCFSASAASGPKTSDQESATGDYAPTHCKPDEKVIFSCPLKTGKTVSLCASPDLARGTGALQYRFGKTGQPLKLAYPKPAKHPGNYFSLDSSHGGQWSLHELGFSVGEFRYEILVQTNSAIPEDGASLSVFRGRRRVADMECRFDEATNNMWMLEELGIPPPR